jgi:hypothetical protein
MEGWRDGMEIGREWMDVLLCGRNWFGWMDGWKGGLQWVAMGWINPFWQGMGWDGMGYHVANGWMRFDMFLCCNGWMGSVSVPTPTTA